MKDTDKRERLMLLSGLKDLRVSKDDPDIRGWEVVTADKKKVGKVHELVIDTVDMMVRYLDVDVDGKILDVKGGSHLLIPIAGAQLDDADNRVYLTDITVEELRALPPYDHRRITRDFETNIASWFERTRGGT
ncbi:MAG: PRC-barrel domain-containing protein, partial [Thermoanaerobaculia bacterium]